MSHSDYELGVNGSAVTLFADPENAVMVNEGVTLIPWMGDSSNLIDRYLKFSIAICDLIVPNNQTLHLSQTI